MIVERLQQEIKHNTFVSKDERVKLILMEKLGKPLIHGKGKRKKKKKKK